jgi:hypothetical protein
MRMKLKQKNQFNELFLKKIETKAKGLNYKEIEV